MDGENKKEVMETFEELEGLRSETVQCIFEIEAVADMSVDASCNSKQKEKTDFTTLFCLIQRLSNIAGKQLETMDGLLVSLKNKTKRSS